MKKKIGCILTFIFIMTTTTGLVAAYPHSAYTVIYDVPSHMVCEEGKSIEIPVKVIDQYSGRRLRGTEYTEVVLVDTMKNKVEDESGLDINGSAVLNYTPDRIGEIPLQIEYYPDHGYVTRVNLTVHVYQKIK